MRVTLIDSLQLGSQALCAGVEVDVDDGQAQAWIDAGQAVSADPVPVAPAAPAVKKKAAAPNEAA